MRLKVSYYDDPDHNPGAVTTKLAQDAYLIHNMTTGVIGVIVLNISTITTGLIIAFYYHWILALIVIGLSPFLAISGSINVKRLKQLATQADEAFKDAGNQISDTVTNIKTVKSFGKLNYIETEF
jgi:ATP-binding cassette subfamily B (MDR/TAP) protein 1